MNLSTYTEWCNSNEGRAYPVAENATHLDNNGALLPNDIIVDLGIIVPNEYVTGIRISSIYVSPQLISVGISSDASGLLVGSYVRSNVIPYTAYPLSSLVDNVSGWIVFGSHRSIVVENYRFDTAIQSAVETRAVRVIPPPGVTQFKGYGNDPALSARNVVKLEGGPAFIIELDPDDPQNILVRLNAAGREQFCQPCTQRANSESCGVPVIRRVNNVPPDADGILTLRFE